MMTMTVRMRRKRSEVEMLEGSGAEGADSCEGDEHSSGESSSDDTISHSDSDSVPAPTAAAPKSTAKPVQKDTAPEFGSKRTSERKETKSLKRQQITGEVEKTKSGNTIKKNRVR